jgi:hypothetical protein
MFKWILSILVYFIATIVFAQTTLFNSQKNARSANTLSPQEFKNEVNALGRQNMDKINQDIRSTLKPPIKAPQIPEHAKEMNQPMQQPPTQAPAPTVQQAPAAPIETTLPPEQPLPAPTQNNAMTPVPQQPVQPQTPGYTGFQGGSGTGSTNTNSTQPSNGGGWNIKY